MAWLLDTSILSEVRKPNPSLQVVTFVAGCPSSDIFVSSVTLADIRYGIETVSDPGRKHALANWLTQSVRPMFDGRVLPITGEITLRWRILVEKGRKSGHTFS
jgi:hypothetical protein